jgi:hypothetical protein
MALAPGWTWIGYMPTQRMSVDEAMVIAQRARDRR